MSKKSLPTGYPQRLSLAAKTTDSRKRKSRGFQQSLRRSLQYFYWRLVRLRGRPEVIARGLACGVFAGMFPFFGFQMITGVLLATLAKGNKLAAVVGTWVSPPLAEVAIYTINFKIGQWLLPGDDKSIANVSLHSWEQVQVLGIEILVTLLVGCFVMGSIGAIISYFLGFQLIRRWRSSYYKRFRRKRLHHQYPESS